MWDGMGTTRRSVSRRHHRVLWDRRNWQDLARGIRSAGRLPLLAGILVAGMVVGRGMVGTLDGDLGEQAAALAGGFLAQRSGQTALETFLASFLSSGVQLLLLFFWASVPSERRCSISTPSFGDWGWGSVMGPCFTNMGGWRWDGSACCCPIC